MKKTDDLDAFTEQHAKRRKPPEPRVKRKPTTKTRKDGRRVKTVIVRQLMTKAEKGAAPKETDEAAWWARAVFSAKEKQLVLPPRERRNARPVNRKGRPAVLPREPSREVRPGVVTVPLPHGQFALIDKADAPAVLQHRWCLSSGYPSKGAGSSAIRLHTFLLGPPGTGPAGLRLVTDHVNGDPLDNRRANLRRVTYSENMKNKRNRWTGQPRSGYRGVTWYRPNKCWVAKFSRHHLGYFTSADEAARAYNDAVRQLHGANVPAWRLNVIPAR